MAKSDYRAAVGANVALGSLTRINPQPTSPGLKFARRTLFGDASLLDQGAYVEWNYNVIEDRAELIQIFTPLGLHLAKSSIVTIYTRDDTYEYHRYRGVAIRPPANWDNYYIRSITIIIRNLELLA